MNEFSRAFRGVWIPRDMWFNKSIGSARFLWSEIDSLQGQDDSGCTASNQYLADFMMCQKRCVQNHLTTLLMADLIEIHGEGKNRIIRTKTPTVQECARCTGEHPSDTSVCTPLSIIDSKAHNKESESGDSSPRSSKDDASKRIFDHWLSKKNLIHHRKMTKSMKSAIQRVLREYEEADLCGAIDAYDTAMGWGEDSFYGYYHHSLSDFFRAGVQKAAPLQKFLPEAEPMKNLRRKRPPEKDEEQENCYVQDDEIELLLGRS